MHKKNSVIDSFEAILLYRFANEVISGNMNKVIHAHTLFRQISTNALDTQDFGLIMFVYNGVLLRTTWKKGAHELVMQFIFEKKLSRFAGICQGGVSRYQPRVGLYQALIDMRELVYGRKV